MRSISTTTSIRLSTLLVVLASLILVFSVSAEIPRNISYQGFLTDGSGNPVADGNYQIWFSIYDVPSGGTHLWQEIQWLEVTDGQFTAYLGAVNSLIIEQFDDTARWLGIRVEPDPDEIDPRIKLSGVPWSVRAEKSDSSGFAYSIANNSVTSNKISNGTILFEDFDHNSASTGQVIKWSGSQWQASDDETGVGASGWMDNGTQIDLTNYGDTVVVGNPDLTIEAKLSVFDDVSSGYVGVCTGARSVEAHAYDANTAFYGRNITNGTRGTLGSPGAGVYGNHGNGNYGRIGEEYYAVYGEGYDFGSGNRGYGVYGTHGDSANYGFLGGYEYGAYGRHYQNGNSGYMGSRYYGVYGAYNSGQVYGYIGGGAAGLRGYTSRAGAMITSCGVWGEHVYGSMGKLATPSSGVYGSDGTESVSWAGYFSGNVYVSGTVSKGGGSFTIDHPLDPENKILQHSFVESPDMMNVYNGNAILDENGEALVTLPDYFEALNRDFRYQLTCIGGFAQVYISEEISGNRFKIAGGTPGLKVSWQVTGVRQDPFAEANRIEVEVDKDPSVIGKYLHPKARGLGIEYSVEYDEIQASKRALEAEQNGN